MLTKSRNEWSRDNRKLIKLLTFQYQIAVLVLQIENKLFVKKGIDKKLDAHSSGNYCPTIKVLGCRL